MSSRRRRRPAAASRAGTRATANRGSRSRVSCWGFGGTFSIKYGEISSAMAENKCAHIQASGARAVVLGDLGCMLNIEGRLRRRGDAKMRVLHVAEVLAGMTEE